MDWTQTKTLAEANLDSITSKASNPWAALSALEGKIDAEVTKVEASLASLDQRLMALPGLLEEVDRKVAKLQSVLDQAKQNNRADLIAAATARLQSELAASEALNGEFDSADQVQSDAADWIAKLHGKRSEIHTRLNKMGPEPRKPLVLEDEAPAAAPAPEAKPAAKPAAKPSAKDGALDDEFAALMADMDISLDQIELPKRATPVLADSSDDGIPDMVVVSDNELPEGEELEDEAPKAAAPKAAPAKAPVAAPVPAKAAVPAPVAKAATPAVAKSQVPAAAPKKEEKGSKAWLWITLTLIALGGGAAYAKFGLHLF